jgi:hypothetical protein
MAYHTDDIDEKILDAINAIFRMELQQEPAQRADSLALRTLGETPLQDDPTLTAPYLTYSNYKGDTGESICSITHGQEAGWYGSLEIGGPIRYLYRYTCVFGTPEVTQRHQARADAACLMNRITATLIKYASLSNVLSPGELMSEDETKRLEGQNPLLVTNAGYSIFGGENTFFGKGKVMWQYPVSWYLTMLF